MEQNEIKEPVYKKWWFWLAVVVIVLSIGFLTYNKVKNNPKSKESISNEQRKEFYKLNQVAKAKDQTITVTDVEKSKGNDVDKPAKGNEFIIATVQIRNMGKEKLEYNPSYFKIEDSKGKTIGQALTTINSNNYLKLGKLDVNEQITGTLIFEVPKGDKGLVLVYKNNVFVDKRKLKFNLTK